MTSPRTEAGRALLDMEDVRLIREWVDDQRHAPAGRKLGPVPPRKAWAIISTLLDAYESGLDHHLFHGHHPACPYTIEGDWSACDCGAAPERLDAAWAEAERALPKGWSFGLTPYWQGDGWFGWEIEAHHGEYEFDANRALSTGTLGAFADPVESLRSLIAAIETARRNPR